MFLTIQTLRKVVSDLAIMFPTLILLFYSHGHNIKVIRFTMSLSLLFSTERGFLQSTLGNILIS